MGLEAKYVFGERASYSDTEVTVHPRVYWYLASKAADAEESPSEGLDLLRADQPGAVRDQMAPALHPYVLLNFLLFSEAADKRVPFAVLFHRNIAPVIIIRHDWQAGLNAEDSKYLIELMDDCTNTSPEQELALFKRLECFSIGPLRATGSGIATAESLASLIYEVLGRADVPGHWTTQA
jgi:hypothetical protein